MTVRPILRWPDPRLRAAAAPVGAVDDGVRAVWIDMVDTMRAMPGGAGVGLAAPQIGQGLALAVVEAEEGLIRLADPWVIHASARMRTGPEASPCLPGVSADVTRPRAVTVRHLDEAGNWVERDFAGLGAVSVQHQIDHLAGRLYVAHLSRLRRDRLVARSRRGTARS